MLPLRHRDAAGAVRLRPVWVGSSPGRKREEMKEEIRGAGV
jgi:hypothetical protein